MPHRSESHWDIDAAGLAEMLEEALLLFDKLSEIGNALAAAMDYLVAIDDMKQVVARAS